MFYEKAKKKLEEEGKGSMGRYGDAMKAEVSAALLEFCRQNEEFAEAVANGGGFKDCMVAVSKQITGNSISDMKAFGAAVEFYFPGAGIDVKMTIDLCASVKKETPAPEEKRGVVIDLSTFF